MNINQLIAKVSSVYEKRYFPTEQKTKILKFISQGGVADGCSENYNFGAFYSYFEFLRSSNLILES